MKKITVFLCFLLCAMGCLAEQVGILGDIMRPSSIDIYKKDLIIVEGAVISIYSLDDLKLKKKFGGRGEGPGEMMVTPLYSIRTHVSPKHIMVESFHKLSYFTHDGEFIRETKKKTPAEWIPIDDHFLVRTVEIDKDKTEFQTLSLYNAQMEKIKELFRQRFIFQALSSPMRWEMEMDFLTFAVQEDKIFIEKSKEGFVIDVLDKKGNQLYRIQKPFQKIPCTAERKKGLVELLKEDDLIKRESRKADGWENYRKGLDLRFPDFFPAIRSIEGDNNRLYVRTYAWEKDKEEYIVMDLKGKQLKRVFVKRQEKLIIMSQMLGAKLSCISNEKLYYLQENEDEEWGLYVEVL